jgi:hypothetical protein
MDTKDIEIKRKREREEEDKRQGGQADIERPTDKKTEIQRESLIERQKERHRYWKRQNCERERK